MSPKSKASYVKEIKEEHGKLFKVQPKKGEPFLMGENQKLDLYLTKKKPTSEIRYCELTIGEYIDKSKSFKHIAKLYRSGIDFNENKLMLDPYFLGVILGDGSVLFKRVNVTTPDEEIVNEIYKQKNLFNLDVRKETKPNNIASTYHFIRKKENQKYGYPNKLRDCLDELGIMGHNSGEKFIPHNYLFSSKNQRLKLLAGLLDTDGYLGNNTFEYVSKSEQLANDILFLSRSLGFAAYLSEKIVNNTIYYRLSISGDTSIIPNKVKRKMGSERKQIKNVLVTGLDVQYIGEGKYLNIYLHNDGKFLKDDFTVLTGS